MAYFIINTIIIRSFHPMFMGTYIAKIMHSLKRYTAAKANKILGRKGAFWQHESYDHVIRSQEEFDKIINYIQQNPVKAGLVKNWREWKWIM